ncbi:hypothetical protein, partial [Micromonospora sp. LOL_027]|uniref:hypothetical protein n=1 Tax=Micromonospora sp. LOL_027 TaxID=3345419 RepID=UPI003A8C6E6E
AESHRKPQLKSPSTDYATALLRDWLRRHPMLADWTVHSWTSEDGRVTCHWGGHTAGELGGVSHTAATPAAFALFGGRPVLWRDGEADGATAIDARTYLADPARWSHDLDGRHCVVRVDDQQVHVQTDASLPLYLSQRDGATWISNAAALVTPPGARPRPRAMAAFLAGGWGMTGEPLREGVDRLAASTLHTFARDTSCARAPRRLGYAQILKETPDYRQATDMFVSLARAFATWPGRPIAFALTGGKDSRLVAAALRAAGISPTTLTFAFSGQVGYPETGDVRIARRLAEMLRWRHDIVPVTESAPVYRRLPEVMDILGLVSPQTTSLADFMDTTELVPGDPPRILFDGVGGEIGRGAWAAYLGGDVPHGGTVAEMADAVLEKIIPCSPAPLVNADALALLREWTRRFVETEVDDGVALDDIPEVLHLERMSNWHGPNLANRAHREDAVSMYLSPRLWPHMIGGGGDGGRYTERFRNELLAALGPDLAALPYEAGQQTWLYDSAVARTLTAERRRAHAIPVEPIGTVLEAARTAVHNQPEHPAWNLIDRKRVSELLRNTPDQFRGIERYQLWTLTTMFCTPNGDPA